MNTTSTRRTLMTPRELTTNLSQRTRVLTFFLANEIIGALIGCKGPRSTLEVMENRGAIVEFEKTRKPIRQMQISGPIAAVYGATKVLLEALKDLDKHGGHIVLQVKLDETSPAVRTVTEGKIGKVGLVNVPHIRPEDLASFALG